MMETKGLCAVRPLSTAWLIPFAWLAFGCQDGQKSTDSGLSFSDEDAVARAGLQLSFPLAEPDLFGTVLGVDHDPSVYKTPLEQLTCLDYLERTFPHCYDEHDGSDYILSGGFDRMDDGSTSIIAAAAGTVLSTADGNYDHCHGDLTTGSISCDGEPMAGNGVLLEHDTGHQTLYWHMMKGSVAVQEGDTIDVGDHLGLVGSSGMSHTPHLHFELTDADGTVVDPYAGPLSQEETFWCDQGNESGLPGTCDP